jgi:thiol:disulfide interchange protein DsbD
MVLIALAAWLLRLGGRWGIGLGVAAILGLAVLTGSIGLPQAAADTSPSADRFSTQRLSELRAQHRAVFIDMTAAWCVTCIVNERVALHDTAVQAAFAQRNVAQLVGDWTRQDAEITAYLRAQGRDGVPLYVYYPADGEAVVLPQILTPGIVLAALK